MAKPLKRKTQATMKALAVFLENPEEEHYGLEIINRSLLGTRTVYALLERLEELGWIEGRIENHSPKSLERPLRRYYRLTTGGYREALRLFDSPADSKTRVSLDKLPDIANEQSFRIRNREEFYDFENNTVHSLNEIEVLNSEPTAYEHMCVTESDRESPSMQVHQVLINGIDHTENIEVRKHKVVHDLVRQEKITHSSIMIPSHFAKNKSIVLEVKSTYEVLKAKGIYHTGIVYPVDQYSLQLNMCHEMIEPNCLKLGLVSKIGLDADGPVDLNATTRSLETLTFKDNKIIWATDKAKLGSSYLIDFSQALKEPVPS